MPDYDFRSLSPVDFEHLARDVLNADLGLRLHSYAAGRDQGIDLRQVDGDRTTVVAQCKHYLESSRATFLRAVHKEGERGQSLAADRYLFVTSRPMTPQLQDDIRGELAGLPVAHDDVWGREALNAALGRCPEVERQHIKLWISSAEVLNSLIHSGQWQRSEALLAALADRARVWVHTHVYDQALDMLKHEGVCIVSGPPGVGKTFLAEMALLAAANSGWQVVHVGDNIEEAWSALRPDETPQIFYYDDFLGQAALELASKNEPASLSRFLERIRQLKDSKRIILTTREQILRQAAEGPADRLSELARYPARVTLQIESYDLYTRAEILFNHLYFSDLPPGERDRIAIDNRLITIAEHPSYSPRIIEIGIRMALQPTADEVLATISRALNNPRDVWQGSFRGLTPLEQQLLLTLATLPRRPWRLEEIRQLIAVDDALAWTPALRKLESTWLQLTGDAAARSVTFANPGCRDYLIDLLDDTAIANERLDRVALLAQLMSLAQSAGLVRTGSGPRSVVQRAGLASAMTSRRLQLRALIRQLADAVLEDGACPVLARMKTLNDAAALLAVFGAITDTGWFLDHIENLVEVAEDGSVQLPVVEGLALAEAVSGVPSDEPERRTSLASAAAEAAAEEISRVRELDAYEALPDHLKTPQLRTLVLGHARRAIEAEREYLLHSCNDPEAVRSGTLDLDQRAKWYGIEIDIAPMLDRAEDLAAQSTSYAGWPEALGELDDEHTDNSRAELHQTFARLSVDSFPE